MLDDGVEYNIRRGAHTKDTNVDEEVENKDSMSHSYVNEFLSRQNRTMSELTFFQYLYQPESIILLRLLTIRSL